MAFLQNNFDVRLCWELEEPKLPKKDASKGLAAFLARVDVFAYVGLFQEPEGRQGRVTRGSAPHVPKRSVEVVPGSRSKDGTRYYFIEHSTTHAGMRWDSNSPNAGKSVLVEPFLTISSLYSCLK